MTKVNIFENGVKHQKTKINQTIRPLIILRFVSVTSQGLDFQCHMGNL
jgi:hypothetical protein